ncbi:MAG: FAD:protein FMN transferase [Phycisphaeraceae bacterium]
MFYKLVVMAMVLSGLLLSGCVAEAPVEAEAGLRRFVYEQPHMGTTFRIVLYASDDAAAEAASDAAFARIDALNASLSDYDPESELSRLSAKSGSGVAVPVSDDLFYMLKRSREFSQATDGAFDITVGPLVRLWRRARRRGERPAEAYLAEAREAVGFEHIQLDEGSQTALLAVPEMGLDLGGIGKGYATAEALAVLREHGVGRALVDGGGDVALGDPPPDAPGWRVAVVQPIAGAEDEVEPRYLVADNVAVATSGDVFQFVEIAGVRYSHIIDPRTGEPTTTPLAVTVIAEDATTADALASSIAVMGPEAGLAFTEAFGAAAVITTLGEVGEAVRQQTDSLKQYTITTE